MNTYQNLEDIALAYLQDSTPITELFPGVVDEAALTVKLKELVLRAANNARKGAERMHNFALNEVSAMAVIPAGGKLSLASLVDEDSAEVVKLNVLTEMVYENWPIALSSRVSYYKQLYRRGRINRVMGVRSREAVELIPEQSADVEVSVKGYRWMTDYGASLYYYIYTGENDWTAMSYGVDTLYMYRNCLEPSFALDDIILYSPADGNTYQSKVESYSFTGSVEHVTLSHEAHGISDFSSFFVYPVSDSSEGDVTLKAVTPVENTDWMLEHGFDYLQWATICEVNHLVQHFLNRTEGTLPPPVRSRDAAFEQLMRWDVDMAGSHYNDNIL